MQNDRFAELFFAVAETDPETATEIALALFASAPAEARRLALLAVEVDPSDAATRCGVSCPICNPAVEGWH